ncbi:TIGR00266 family protein [Brooklawnia cerclae]|uniref:Uncharacterized protein (TIGR00266 family) n=1 Tax=Brooklawnia cerclae TaxID=349934 RepID=A0ABX0SGA9_9ACTN|nr:TIGR00266 family protein [Brooklawnia cerclae]NIH57422.1 uncharacterized protein (TIGR00266 family) [Brooklawnia cerclae]
MEISLRHNPSFAVARVFLAPNEPMKVQSGAMMAHSNGIQVDAKMEGGLMAGLKRSMLAGESLFITTMTAPPQGGWVDVAGTLPGDIMPLEIQPNRPFFITRGCWIANSHAVVTDSRWGGASNFFGGEGGFGLQASGQGLVLLSVYGALDVIDLQPGEQVVIDSGHVVAYDLGTRFQLRQAARGQVWKTLKSGEGFVFDFYGPGRIFLQTRNPSALEQYIRAAAPSSS